MAHIEEFCCVLCLMHTAAIPARAAVGVHSHSSSAMRFRFTQSIEKPPKRALQRVERNWSTFLCVQQ